MAREFKQFNLNILEQGGSQLTEEDLLTAVSNSLNNTSTPIRTGSVGGVGRPRKLRDLLTAQGDWFGTGVDGAVTYSVNTTLTADVYASTLIIQTGVSVNCGQFRIFAQEFIQLEGTAKVTANGNAGTNGVAGNNAVGCVAAAAQVTAGVGGAALAAGTLPGGVKGGDGGDGEAQSTSGSANNDGEAGLAVSNVLVGNGVAGGDGGSGGIGNDQNDPGAAGVGTLAGSKPITPTNAVRVGDENGYYAVSGGTGGGGGGEGGISAFNDAEPSGGSGAGSGSTAGFILLSAPRILLQPGTTLEAIGGAGGNGGDGGSGSGCGNDNWGAGGGGAGSGGNGGVVILVFSQSLQNKGNITVTGGAAGTGGALGTGASANGTAGENGTVGNAGTSFEVQIA